MTPVSCGRYAGRLAAQRRTSMFALMPMSVRVAGQKNNRWPERRRRAMLT